MEQVIRNLINLHVTEVRVQVLEEFLASVPGQLEALAAERDEAQKQMDEKRAELGEAKGELKRKERALADGEDKIRQLQAKLNQVKTNKEYEAALREIDEQKRANGKLEEEILILFDKVEAVEQVEKKLEAGWADRVREFEARERELKVLSGKVDQELNEKKGVREGLVSGLSPELIKLFTKIRDHKGRALARADKEICQGCFRQLPAQLYNEVLKGDRVLTCPHCERILVYSEAELEEGLLEIQP